ncbi:hypothetical protein WDU94_000543, partial [Cyamophila willieti]
KKRQRNLSTGYIDYKKAYDLVPHTWIIYTLKLYKINPIIIRFLENAMKKWNINLVLSNNRSSDQTWENAINIKINRGIFQGDSASGLLFCLVLNPLSTILKKEKNLGFLIKGNNIQYNVSHLMYMDDIKIYTKNEQQLKSTLKIIEQFSADIKMEFGIDKCKLQNLARGKVKEITPYQTATEQDIKQLEPNEIYKYLGMIQTKRIEQNRVKEQITKEYNRRLSMIAKTHLNSRNLSKAINTFAIPILTYSFGIVNWSETDLESLERKIRTTLTKNSKHHPRSAIERISLPRNQGGRGIVAIKDLHKKQIHNLSQYFSKRAETSELHDAIRTSDDNYTPCRLNQPTERPEREDRITPWQAKPLHGKYPHILNDTSINKIQSLQWLKKGLFFPETEAFIISMQDGVTPTKNYRKIILKEPIESDKCRRCNQTTETLDHIIGGCLQLAPSEYKARHDNMGKIIHLEIAKKYHLITKPTVADYQYNPQPVLQDQDNKYILYWDRAILTELTALNNRPDVILWKKREAKAYLIDFAVVNANNLEKTRSQKITKYQQLAFELKGLWRVQEVIILPIIISTLGLIPESLLESMRKLDIHSNVISRLQHSVLLSTANITRKFLDLK